MIKATIVALATYVAASNYQIGIASYYSDYHHGRTTASGEIYDMEAMTAAHRKIEFGTHVKVTNMDNGKTVVVEITDRGPYVNGRVIDLSKAAARKIDMEKPGIARVKLEIIQ